MKNITEVEFKKDMAELIKKAKKQPYVTGTGQKIIRTHSIKDCEGFPCVIHNPSEHRMSSYPTHWREDRGLMERMCPHGVGHPDPDDIAHKKRTRGAKYAEIESIHGCCGSGCCIERRSEDYGRRKVSKL